MGCTENEVDQESVRELEGQFRYGREKTQTNIFLLIALSIMLPNPGCCSLTVHHPRPLHVVKCNRTLCVLLVSC